MSEPIQNEKRQKDTLTDYLSTLPAAELSYPFGPDPMVFKVMNKMFALVSTKDSQPIVNFKAGPVVVDMLVEQYADITRGYHMNKKHWISVTLGADISDEGLFELAQESYNLVASKLTKKDKAKLENVRKFHHGENK